MVDTLRDIAPGTIVIAGDVHFKVYKIDSKPAKVRHFQYKVDGRTLFGERPWMPPHAQVLATFTVVQVSAKTVPTTWRGPASSSDCKYHTMTMFVEGNQEAYQAYLASCQSTYRTVVDLGIAMVAPDPDAPKPIGNLKGFNKMDMICAVIMVHGPSTRDDILRRVAAMEGKPWVVSSNHEYFSGNRQGAIEDHARIERRKKLFRCTVDGLRRGAAVIDRLGTEAIKSLA